MMSLQAETYRKKRGHVLKGEIKAAIRRYMYVRVFALFLQQDVQEGQPELLLLSYSLQIILRPAHERGAWLRCKLDVAV
jgi:hypothetical protein